MKDQGHTRATSATSQWETRMVDACLPPQQARIAYFLLTGLGDKQIAKAMGIGLPTVRTHMTRLFARTGSKDRVELILHMVGQFHAGCHRLGCTRVR